LKEKKTGTELGFIQPFKNVRNWNGEVSLELGNWPTLVKKPSYRYSTLKFGSNGVFKE
jgi:hypothetical protein